MARLQKVKREALPEDKQQLYDGIVARLGDMNRTVYSLLLNHPELAQHVAALGAFVQRTSFDPAIKEIAILTTARALDSQFVWTIREPMALADGVAPAAIAAIREKRAPAGLSERDATLFVFARQMVERRRVDSDVYSGALDLLGEKGLLEYSLVVGFYTMLITMLAPFELGLPEDTPPLLPL